MGIQPYGTVSSSTSQFVSSITTAKLITYETNEILNLITHSTTENPSRIAIQSNGAYLITFSALQTGGAGDVDIWLRKNGTDVSRSNTRSHTATVDYRIVTVTFIVTGVSNDYFELIQSSTSTAIGLVSLAAGTNPTRPSIPSIILTINKISD